MCTGSIFDAEKTATDV